MGLDLSHDAGQWSYSGFHRWRKAIAVAAGFTIDEYGDGCPILDWSKYSEEDVQGEWDSSDRDPIIYLLVHSDCDGVIHPRESKLLADRLSELLPKLPEEKTMPPDRTTRRIAERLIIGLRKASAAGEDLEFS